MNRFRVWICPSEDHCDVHVDGISNAHWLLSRLGREFVFKTIDPIREEAGSTQCSFRVPYKRPMSPAMFEQLLAAIPPVQLMLEPALQKSLRHRGHQVGHTAPEMTT